MPTGRGEERLVVEPQAAVCQDRIFLPLKPFLQKNRQGKPLATVALCSLLVRLALLVRSSMHTCVLQTHLKSELKAVYIVSQTPWALGLPVAYRSTQKTPNCLIITILADCVYGVKMESLPYVLCFLNCFSHSLAF